MTANKNIFIIFWLILLSFISEPSKAVSKIDSLINVMGTAIEDTTIIETQITLFSELLDDNPNEALEYAKKAMQLSIESNYTKGIAKSSNNIGYGNYRLGNEDVALEYYHRAASAGSDIDDFKTIAIAYANIGHLFSGQGNLPKAVEYFEKALAAAQTGGDEQRAAQLFNNIGVVFYHQGYYSKALENYIESEKLHEKSGNKRGVAYALSNIGIIYAEQKNYEKSLEYYERSMDVNRELGDKKGVAGILNNIGDHYFSNNDLESASIYYSQALKICRESGFTDMEAKVLNNIGGVYFEQKEYAQALDYYAQTLQMQEEIGDMQGIATTWSNLANIQFLQDNYDEALQNFKKSLEIAKKSGLIDKEKDNYSEMADVYAKIGEFEKAFYYKDLHTILKDSLAGEEEIRLMADIRIKYDTEKKENEIRKLTDQQKAEQKLNRILIFSISLGFVLVIVIALISFNSYRLRQRHKRLKVQREADNVVRESEKRMIGKVIETEEKERKRFAKDLHDGIGPLLSSIKLYVNELTDDETEAEERDNMLTYTNQLIDDAVKSTRTIANNLMPAVISDYGLVSAIKSFCEKMSLNKSVKINFESQTEERFEKTVEIMLYRIVLEMINNTIKHAEAKNIHVKLQKSNDELHLQYKDDGKGFDLEKTLADPKRGLGLSNITTRVSSVGGNCEMKSKPGSGYLVDIKIDLQFFRK